MARLLLRAFSVVVLVVGAAGLARTSADVAAATRLSDGTKLVPVGDGSAILVARDVGRARGTGGRSSNSDDAKHDGEVSSRGLGSSSQDEPDDDDNSGPGGGDDKPDDDNSGPGGGDDKPDDDNSGPGGGDDKPDDDNSGPGGGDDKPDDDNSGPGGGDDEPDDDNSGPGGGDDEPAMDPDPHQPAPGDPDDGSGGPRESGPPPEGNRYYVGTVSFNDGASVLIGGSQLQGASRWLPLLRVGTWIEAYGRWEDNAFVADEVVPLTAKDWSFYRGPASLVASGFGDGQQTVEGWIGDDGNAESLRPRQMEAGRVWLVAYYDGRRLVALPEDFPPAPDGLAPSWVELSGRVDDGAVVWERMQTFP